ncbi:MAG: zinc-dependent metalloprotease family protein [Gemmataceae bacterium]
MPAGAVGNSLLWQSYTQAQAFSLHSLPGASKVIYLDFDGQTISGTNWNTSVNGGNPIVQQAWSMDANRAAFSGTERDAIIRMWRMVAEDFIPFNIDVTTEDPGVAALTYSGAGDTTWGKRVVIGPKPTVSNPSATWTSAGGIAYLNTFQWSVDEPAFCWNGDGTATPEFSLPDTVSHEVGHTLGLSHDGTAALTYYPGHGAGATSWGPIMGGPFGMNLTQWSQDAYPGANNPEDDLAIITGGVNGVSYTVDDTGNTIAASNRDLNAHSDDDANHHLRRHRTEYRQRLLPHLRRSRNAAATVDPLTLWPQPRCSTATIQFGRNIDRKC